MHPIKWCTNQLMLMTTTGSNQFAILLLSFTFTFQTKNIFSRKTFSVSSEITVRLTLACVLTGLGLVLDPYKDLYRVLTQTPHGQGETPGDGELYTRAWVISGQDPWWLGNGAGSPWRLAHREGVKTARKDGLFLEETAISLLLSLSNPSYAIKEFVASVYVFKAEKINVIFDGRLVWDEIIHHIEWAQDWTQTQMKVIKNGLLPPVETRGINPVSEECLHDQSATQWHFPCNKIFYPPAGLVSIKVSQGLVITV